MSPLRILIATWFGAGYSPFASGTVGTLFTVPLVLLLWWIDLPWAAWLGVAGIVTLLGRWAADGAEEHWGKKDPGQVVVDETAGYLVATAGLPHATLTQGLVSLAVSFFLFRAFDVLKPPPARQLEAVPGAWGIMLDDLAAGGYANLAWWGLAALRGSWS